MTLIRGSDNRVWLPSCLDPLALLSGPLTAVTKEAGRGLLALDKASDAVTAKGIDTLADSSVLVVAMKWAKKNNLPISESTFHRPLVAQEARRQTTLDEVVSFGNAKGTREARCC